MDTYDSKAIVVTSTDSSFLNKVRSYLNHYEIIERRTTKLLEHLLRKRTVECILLHIKGDSISEELNLHSLKKKFITVPILAVIPDYHIELARQCGKLGIDRVITMASLDNIECEISFMLTHNKIMVSLAEFGIPAKEEKWTEVITEALSIIESNYLKVTSVTEIAQLIGISESTLSREFQKFKLPGLKRLLMCLKVYHASLLMQNPGLNIREIALLSGFSNDKRLTECFQKVYNLSPGEYREVVNTVKSFH